MVIPRKAFLATSVGKTKREVAISKGAHLFFLEEPISQPSSIPPTSRGRVKRFGSWGGDSSTIALLESQVFWKSRPINSFTKLPRGSWKHTSRWRHYWFSLYARSLQSVKAKSPIYQSWSGGTNYHWCCDTAVECKTASSDLWFFQFPLTINFNPTYEIGGDMQKSLCVFMRGKRNDGRNKHEKTWLAIRQDYSIHIFMSGDIA